MAATNRGRLLCVALPVLCGTVAAAADHPGAAGALEGLQQWLDGTRALECRFEQELLSGALGAGLVESGTLYVGRPGRMRWDYRDPEVKVALIDRGRMLLYLAEDRQLIVSEIPEEGDLLPTLLTGTARLDRLFDAELVQEVPADPLVELRLLPRDRVDSFEEVVLTLRRPAWAIERAQVMDAAGNRMEYRFYRLKRNRELPRGVFSFEPPPGTEIVDQP